jgi:Autographiviridae endonuclease VII
MFSHSAWHKKRFAENAEYREKVRAGRRRHRQKHKEKIRERRKLKMQNDPEFRQRELARNREWQRRKRYEQVYGISLDDYDAILKRQKGACAICKRDDGLLCVDHCHGCNHVRGLLCNTCNSALGFCNDSPEHLLAAAAYLLVSRGNVQTIYRLRRRPQRTYRESARVPAVADGRHCRCAGKDV